VLHCAGHEVTIKLSMQLSWISAIKKHLHICVERAVDTDPNCAFAVYILSTVFRVLTISLANILIAPVLPFFAKALHSLIDLCSDRFISEISLSIALICFAISLFHCFARSTGSTFLAPNPKNPPPELLLLPPPELPLDLPPPLFAKNIILKYQKNELTWRLKQRQIVLVV
jgi:hypothetical protein